MANIPADPKCCENCGSTDLFRVTPNPDLRGRDYRIQCGTCGHVRDMLPAALTSNLVSRMRDLAATEEPWYRGEVENAQELLSKAADALERAAHETSAPLIDWKASHAMAIQQRDKLARWIVHHPPELPDHACSKCMPHGGDLVRADFVCSYHLATELIARPAVKTSPAHSECTRSHPHENMGPECEYKTEIARAEAQHEKCEHGIPRRFCTGLHEEKP